MLKIIQLATLATWVYATSLLPKAVSDSYSRTRYDVGKRYISHHCELVKKY